MRKGTDGFSPHLSDDKLVKSLVCFVAMIATLSTVLASVVAYTYCVVDFGKLLRINGPKNKKSD